MSVARSEIRRLDEVVDQSTWIRVNLTILSRLRLFGFLSLKVYAEAAFA